MLRNTLVFRLIFELAKLVCIALASTAGIIVGISIVLSIGMPIESWLFQLSGSLGAIGAMTTIFSVHQHQTNGPEDYIDFLPGVGRKRGYWWTLNRLLAYWGALPGVILGVLFGGIYALTVGEFFILPALTLALIAMTVAGAFAHYHIRSRISWLPFE